MSNAMETLGTSGRLWQRPTGPRSNETNNIMNALINSGTINPGNHRQKRDPLTQDQLQKFAKTQPTWAARNTTN